MNTTLKNLRVGDIITASLDANPSYYITLIAQSGEHVVEIRPTTKGTTVFYNCESSGADYKQFDLATTSREKQQFTVKAQSSGLVITLDDETVALDVPGCQLAWHQINKLEMGGNCRSYWGNWKSLRVIRNITEEL